MAPLARARGINLRFQDEERAGDIPMRAEPVRRSRTGSTQWMFDAATCSRMRLSVVPSISVRSLRELTQLLSVIGSPADSDVVKAKLLSLPDAGGACATEETAFLRSAGAVSGSHGDSRMDAVSAEVREQTLRWLASFLPRSLSRPRRTGGGGP